MEFGVAGTKPVCIGLVPTLYLSIYFQTRKELGYGFADSAVLTNKHSTHG